MSEQRQHPVEVPEKRSGNRLPHHTVAGVGAGPANLSLAALGEPVVPGGVRLYERRSSAAWHPGQLSEGTRLQTSWIKDLVTLVDPTNRLSFLNYLVAGGRMYSFINAQYEEIPRLEFARYLAWAAAELGTVRYGSPVERVGFDGTGPAGRFVLEGPDGPMATAEHVVLGLGTRPRVPACFAGLDAEGLVLAERLHARLRGAAVLPYQPAVVVGGGQTGAESVLELIQHGFRDIRWVGRRNWFAPMDDSPSANDFFRPAYLRFFHGLPAEVRQRYVAEQQLTSDGISLSTIQQVYQLNHEMYLREGRYPVMLLPGRDVVRACERDDQIVLWCERDWGGRERHAAPLVVLATGREATALPLAPELLALMELDEAGRPVLEADYSVRWKNAEHNRLYVQNRSRTGHGIADPNLSLLAVRAATILNSVLERDVYVIRDEHVSTAWL
ncbi:lysine N(6)-hydroxylase/L-ornithine N(5)-oxygenase family protein [Streptomyces sp. NPDC018045]|uniref:lysine N(6)-hydroxylase/L-ornithine N(5)-oxygenase family protein n=1 Tax=Streptomyces sp. NPDC018045 TaxID=3365037 RepID=UPI0037906DE2